MYCVSLFSTDNGHNYRTVLWPLGAMSRCVSYKCFLPTDVSFLPTVCMPLAPHGLWYV